MKSTCFLKMTKGSTLCTRSHWSAKLRNIGKNKKRRNERREWRRRTIKPKLKKLLLKKTLKKLRMAKLLITTWLSRRLLRKKKNSNTIRFRSEETTKKNHSILRERMMMKWQKDEKKLGKEMTTCVGRASKQKVYVLSK